MKRTTYLLLCLLALALLVLIASERLAWLLRFEYPISTDGFYYLVEFKSWAAGKGSYYGRADFLSPIFGLLTKFTGLPPQQIYLGAVISSLVVAAVALFTLTWQGRRVLFPLLLVAAFLSSDLLFFRHYAFLRQGWSLALFLAGISFFHHAPDMRPSRRKLWFLAAMLCLLVSSLFHVLGLVASILFLVLVCEEALTVAVLVAAAGVAAFIYFAPDIEQGLLIEQLSVLPGWVAACSFSGCSSFEWVEFGLASLAAVALLLLLPWRTHKFAVAFVLFAIILNLPLWNRESHLSHRLALTSVWFIYCGVALAFLGLRRQHSPYRPAVLTVWSFVGVSLVASFLLDHRAYVDPGIPPSLLKLHGPTILSWMDERAAIVAPHGSQFRITYFLGREAKSFASQAEKSKESQGSYLLFRGGRLEKRKCQPLPERFVDIEKSVRCVRLGDGWAVRESR